MGDDYRKKLEGLQRGAGIPVKSAPVQDTSFTEEEAAKIRAAQLMALRNSPTAGQPTPPTAQELQLADDDFNSQMGELGEGEGIIEQPAMNPRFKRLFGK